MDVTPWHCPTAFARCHRLCNRLRALRVTVKLTSGFQWQELIESFQGMCGRPLGAKGRPCNGLGRGSAWGESTRLTVYVLGLTL